MIEVSATVGARDADAVVRDGRRTLRLEWHPGKGMHFHRLVEGEPLSDEHVAALSQAMRLPVGMCLHQWLDVFCVKLAALGTMLGSLEAALDMGEWD